MRDQPSQTAIKIARLTVWLGSRPDQRELLPPDAASTTRALLRAGGYMKPWHERVYGSRTFGTVARATERWMAPGQATGLALRKRFMDDETRAAVADGATQVLVVGAGFDTLASRLARELHHVSFFELDHPATQGAKRACLDSLAGNPEELHLVPVDLTHRSLASVLDELPRWDPHASTMTIAEGLLMYLTEPEVSALFEAVREHTPRGSRLAFSYFPGDARGKPDIPAATGLLRASLHLLGEPWRWAVPDLDAFLRARGYRVLDPVARQDPRERYLEPRGRGHEPWGIERFAVAETV